MTIFEKQETIEAIKTVIKARWFYTMAAALQGFIVRTYFSNVPLMTSKMISIISIIVLLINFLFWLYLRLPFEKIKSSLLKIIKFSQVPMEQLAIATIFYFSGTANKMLFIVFVIPILVGAIIYKLKGVILSVISTMLIYSGLVLMDYYGLLAKSTSIIPNEVIWCRIQPFRGDWLYSTMQLIGFNFYIICVAFYAGYLSILFKRREYRLINQKNELSQKTNLLTEQTEQLQSSKIDLEGEKNKVEAVIKSLTDGLLLLDNGGRIVLANKIAKKILNIADEKLILNKKIVQINQPEIKKISQLLDSGSGILEKVQITASGQLNRILEISTADVLEQDNRYIGKIIVLHDITREKAIDKIKSEFVSITAHQLRTPLTAIKWVFKAILDKDCGQINQEQEEILNKGYKSNERVIVLINDLLEVARIEEGRFINQFSKVAFSDLLNNTLKNLNSLIAEKKIRINIEKAGARDPIILADKEKMEMALFNLIENALLYTPKENLIKITFSTDSKNKQLDFSIKDSGIGIPEENYERIFSKFFRGESAIKIQTEGSGLGLFIIKNIIEGHGGKIWFESEVGKGTTFYITLPLAAK